MRVLQAIGSLSKGGAELQCRLLAENLPASKYEVAILYLYEGSVSTQAHVKKLPVNRGRWSAIPSLWKRIDDAIGDFMPDIVHVWLPEIISVPAAWAAYRRGIPVVSGHRASMCFSVLSMQGFRDRLRYFQYVLADRIVANFDVEEEPIMFRYLYRARKGLVIENGLDLERLRSMPFKMLPLRTTYRLIYAGRLDPKKGLPVAFHAISLLAGAGADVSLAVFGKGIAVYESHLRGIVVRLGLQGRVTFLGEVHDWQAYAGDADALVFPSLGEGTSNVVLESLAIGLPVIISDIAMSRQMLLDGVNAVIVPDNSNQSWKAAIWKTLSDLDLRDRISAAGRKIADQYSIAEMVSRHEELYREAASAGKTAP